MDHDLHSCSDSECNVCRGGLALCTVCGGAEASMPTDCPGVHLSSDTLDGIQSGEIDFVDGEWHTIKVLKK